VTKFAVKNPVSVIVLAVILLIAGWSSYSSLPRESFPEIKIPYIFVNTVLPGASPEDVEKLVTRKIEDNLDGLDGVKKITSQSMESVSAIQVQFNTDVDVETALRRVRDKVEVSKGDLPTDAEDPLVQELNFSNIPILVVSLTSDYDMERLEPIADQLQTRLEGIAGVLEVKISGKRDKEIAVDVDPARLRSFHLSLSDLSTAISMQHRNVPGGTLLAGGNRFTIKVTGELAKPDDFKEIVVKEEDGRIIRLKDVANVQYTYVRERTSIARLNGKPSLSLSITKRTGENLIRIADDVKAAIEEMQKQWPNGTHVTLMSDQSEEIREMVVELQNHIITGVFLVVALISFFLGLRNSFFISTAIPFSMMIGFIVLQLMGITLNMVVLFSLVIALGMLVDDGIVVVENIYRHMAMGKSRVDAAIDGTREVIVPVTTATITTVAAFLPLMWIPGIMGQFMKYLPITVSVTLMGSLFVAFVFNPVFASLFMNTHAKHHDEEGGSFFLRFRAAYVGLLERLVDRPVLVALGCLGFVFAGMAVYGLFGTGAVFFPTTEPNITAASIEGPLGLDIERTDEGIRKAEAFILAMPDSLSDVETVSSITGSAKGEGFGSASEPHKGYVDMEFANFEHRKVPSWTTMAWLSDTLPKIMPGWQVKVEKQQDGPPVGKPVNYEIIGEDFAVLSRLADSVQARLRKVPNLVNIGSDYDPAQPELRVDIDRDQALYLGVSTVMAASAVRAAIYGLEAGKYREGDDEYKIMVRNNPESRGTKAGLSDVMVAANNGPIPLTSIASINEGASLANVRHLDRKRTVQVWAELAPGAGDEQAAKTAAAKQVDAIQVPDGYIVRTGSDNRDQEETQAFIIKAFAIAIALVFLIMVAQFNSIFQPFLVVIGIFLALGGVFWGLTITHVTFSFMMTGVGIVALAGVVAKNSIILIEFTNKLHEEDGLALRDAVIEAGKVRMRPVLLTAIAAMIGLVPMATGVGIDFSHLRIVTKSESSLMWEPLAWAIFWGLLFNTFLVLVATPTFYYTYYRFTAWLKGRLGKKAVTE
jgi:multidrug efflux pump